MPIAAVIGLEVHAQLLTTTKIFCGCSTKFGSDPNSHTCPVCLGMPGALPVLNKKVVQYALKIALATHCRISHVSRFCRKNYFYPDLPKGYQISQYEMPLAEKGWIQIEVNGRIKKVGITRIHLEEDAGKSFHGASQTMVDFNRCGVPLIEIVSAPEMKTPREAVAYLKTLRTILIYLGICDGNMEEGSLRCDANLSVRHSGKSPFGPRTEIKNMNSFRGLRRALEWEIRRQREVVQRGGGVVRETRLWNEQTGETQPMRQKEESSDYRYFPEPDLMPLVIEDKWLKKVRETLPEMPEDKKRRFINIYGLSPGTAEILTSDPHLADYFQACLRDTGDPKMTSNWVINELLREQKTDPRGIQCCPVGPENLAKIIKWVKKGTLSGKMAKDMFHEIYQTGRDPEEVRGTRGTQITDEKEIAGYVKEVLEENTEQVDRYTWGKVRLLSYFIGQVMNKTGGRASPQLVIQILQRELSRQRRERARRPSH